MELQRYTVILCVGLSALSACGGRTVGVIDLDSVNTGLYNITSTEHRSSCSNGSSHHIPITAIHLPVWVGSSPSGVGLVELLVPNFAFGTGVPAVSIKRQQLTAVDNSAAHVVPQFIGCQQSVTFDMVLLEASDDSLTLWYSETWSDRGRGRDLPQCQGGPLEACTSSTVLTYTLAQACARPCQLRPPGAINPNCVCP
jgi:hypothetical protein